MKSSNMIASHAAIFLSAKAPLGVWAQPCKHARLSMITDAVAQHAMAAAIDITMHRYQSSLWFIAAIVERRSKCLLTDSYPTPKVQLSGVHTTHHDGPNAFDQFRCTCHTEFRVSCKSPCWKLLTSIKLAHVNFN